MIYSVCDLFSESGVAGIMVILIDLQGRWTFILE